MPYMASTTARHLAAVVLIVFSADLTIQLASAAPATQLAQGAATQIEAADMENFVAAAKAIVALRRQYEPRLRAARSEAAAQALIEEARVLMQSAITDTGMTVEGYRAIAEAALGDPNLRKRIETAVGAPGQ